MVLARFNEALERRKEEIGQSQRWRYKGGRVPRLLVWLAQRPDLAAALAEDARELASSKDATKGGS
jgi:Ser/Thr protein kinase RdoA (MazF antagonist)